VLGTASEREWQFTFRAQRSASLAQGLAEDALRDDDDWSGHDDPDSSGRRARPLRKGFLKPITAAGRYPYVQGHATWNNTRDGELMNKTTTSDVDRAINEVATAVRSVNTDPLDAIAEDIASAKVIVSFAHPGGPVADAVDLQRHRVREWPGHHLDQLVLASVIRGAFLLIAALGPARVARRRRR
jgi:hypothetical protein